MKHAVDLHRTGRLAEAAEAYEQIIAAAPNDFDATHLLGVVALQEGRLERAQTLIAAALRLRPNDVAALNNLGTVQLRSRQFELALKQFERAVKLEPDSPTALTNLGTALRELGRPRDALEWLRKARAADPKSALLRNLLGACLLDTADPQAAALEFEQATRLEPGDADGWGNLAIALNSIGDLERARECADKAVGMRPSSSAAVAALAAVKFEQGEIEPAVDGYREAVALPDPSVQTRAAFANALWTSGRCEEALDQLRQAVALDGNNAVARWKLTMSHCRPYYDAAADVLPSRAEFELGLADLATWFRAARRPQAYAAVGATQPFYIAYQPYNNRELLRRYGNLCAEWMASMPPAEPPTAGPASVSPTGGTIRVGIASAHIRDHSVWNAIVKGWVQHLDRGRFEVCLFHLGRRTDAETERARQAAHLFEDRPTNLPGWMHAIRQARLDVLIYPEIGMDALTTQLASLRLAPVQAATWGHPETTGLPTMDFYLSADGLEPAEAADNYTERLVRLPNLGAFVDPLSPAIAAPDRKSLGLPADEPLLLCPGTPFKYTPMYDHVWARIAKGLQAAGNKSRWARIAARLRGAGNGRLVFFHSGYSAMDQRLAGRLRRAFDREQVDFDARVRIIPYLDRAHFFGLMQQATLLLDTLGFSGFNNALQAVEAGLPVLAREGEFLRGRLASGIMRRLNLPELVAGSDEDFVAKAIELAGNPASLDALRARILERRAVLFQDVEPVRALERWLTASIK